MTSLFNPVILEKRVALTPKEMTEEFAKNPDAFIVEKLRTEIEGRCCTDGFVQSGSTQVLGRSMGQAEHGHFTGDFIFQVKLQVYCFNPHADQIITVVIQQSNRSGCYCTLVEDPSAIRVLLSRDFHIGNTEFDALTVGQTIQVRILRSIFQVNDPFIQAVGVLESVATDGSQ